MLIGHMLISLKKVIYNPNKDVKVNEVDTNVVL